MTPAKAHAEALRRIAAARATNAEILDLGDLALKELPHELSDLPALRVLALGKTRPIVKDGQLTWAWASERPFPGFADVSALAALANLNTLDLSGCASLSDVSALVALTKLNTLDLSGCASLSDVSALAALAKLNTLNLGSTGVSNVSALAALANLNTLNLIECKSLSDVSALAALAKLNTLDLGRTGVSEVSALAALTNLNTLNLIECKSLSDVSALAALTKLNTLNLGSTGVSNVSALAALANLNTLDLSHTGVSEVSALAALTKLHTLNLEGCPHVRCFAPLRSLLPQLTKLRLYQCDFDDIPSGICGSQWNDNVIHEVRAYYADLEAGAEADAEVKLFVLGNGRVGKTQLVRRLRKEDYDDRVPTTHGVEWHSFSVSAEDGSPVRVNLWDFGGQDIYHGSHALFLDGHAVFVVLWHPDFERGTTTENGITMTNHPLAYWLDYVRAAAGPDAVVLLVQARADSRADEHPLPNVDLGELRVRQTCFSAKTGRRLDGLRAEIGEAVRDLRDARPPHLIGHGRLTVRNQLRAMLAEDQTRPKNQRLHRTLTRAEFDTLCDEAGGVSSSDALLTFLHRTGVVFHNPNLFGGQIILDQQWALDAIYTLLDRTRVMPLFRERGRFTRIDLEQLVWGQYSKDEQQTFLGMMEKCDICFRVRELDDEPVYVAPELLPDESTARRVLVGLLPDGEPDATATARFPFLHDGILRGLLAGIGRVAGDRAHYWRFGCFFYDEQTRSKAVIDVLRNASTDGPAGGTIRFRGWGPDAPGVLEPLLKELDRVRAATAGSGADVARRQPTAGTGERGALRYSAHCAAARAAARWRPRGSDFLRPRRRHREGPHSRRICGRPGTGNEAVGLQGAPRRERTEELRTDSGICSHPRSTRQRSATASRAGADREVFAIRLLHE